MHASMQRECSIDAAAAAAMAMQAIVVPLLGRLHRQADDYLSLSQNLPAQTQDAYIVAERQSIYWARGNGWILAALVRVLDILPTTDPHRSTYVSDFQAMASALVPCSAATASGTRACSIRTTVQHRPDRR